MATQKTYTPADANLTGFASNVTGASFTLTDTNSGDSLAHKISIRNDSATDHSAKTITIVGYLYHIAQAQTISAPGSSATVESTLYYSELTSVTPSATIGADTFDIGWVDEFVTPIIPVNWRGGNANVGINVSGTINYTLEQTDDSIQTKTTDCEWTVDDPTTQASQTADQSILYRAHPRGLRFKANSYSSGATATISIIQCDA